VPESDSASAWVLVLLVVLPVLLLIAAVAILRAVIVASNKQ
jgi:hypothetical protein